MALTLSQATKKLLLKDPFYGLFLMSLDKHFDNNIQTACVLRNGINLELLVNEDFGNSLSDSEKVGICLHEILHLIEKHLTMQKYFSNKERFNIAADATVNQYIDCLPAGCVSIKDLGLPPDKGTKGYYENLPENIEKQFNSIDTHNGKDFQDISDAEKQLIENQVDHLIKQAAEQTIKSNGKIPSHLKNYIEGLLNKRKPIFNGKAYFRRLIGTIQDVELKSTRKRESNRFKGASGLKHKKKSNICVIVDTSGSVSNDELVDFFTEIRYVGQAGTEITIIENDAVIQRIYKYNGVGDGIINGRGGTVFTEACNGYNDHRHDFNTAIFFTDGYADVNLNLMGPSIGVITSDGHKQKYPGKTIYIPKQ